MISAQTQPALLRHSLDRLTAIDAGLPILAFLGVSGHGSSGRDVVERSLSPFFADPGALRAALSGLADANFAMVSRNGRCRITPAGREKAQGPLGPLLGRAWSDVVHRALAPLALGLDPTKEETRRYLARKDNIECAALACLYGITNASALPSRSEVRFWFLRALVSARLPECEPAFTEMTMHNTLRDPFSRALMLGAAGLQRGTMRDAEGALLRKALGARAEAASGIPDALIRNALAKTSPRPLTLGQLPPLTLLKPNGTGAEQAGFAAFAAAVRDLAKTQKTHPYAGRVAIAQVYDAGLQRGLDFGTLEAFKTRVAEAGRAGLLDLERYDIAGPMDAALRDRSRTVFGRDVRHFIVNEWI